MDRESLERSLRKETKGSAWISTSKLRRWQGMGNDKFKRFTDGLSKRVNGNRLEFFVPDVVERILQDVDRA